MSEDTRSEAQDGTDSAGSTESSRRLTDEQRTYLRFGAMIGAATVAMFVFMYLNTYQWDHIRWSETRAYMGLLMGGTMP